MKILLIVVPAIACLGCSGKKDFERQETEILSLSSPVMVKSVAFYSPALRRPAHYLIALTVDYEAHPDKRFPMLFLLHGIDGRSEDWIDKGDVLVCLRSHRIIAVMPDGSDSYYTNAALRSKDHYEDLISEDLLKDVEQHYRVALGPLGHGIGGISMGGYGAIKIALRHPDKFSFAAGLSAALDAPQRPFAIRRLGQSFRYLRIFGFQGSSSRRENNVFSLARRASTAPFLFLLCGQDESLLDVNRSFATLLDKRDLPHEYHEVPGGHSWDSWKREIPEMLNSAEQHLQGVQ